MSLILRNKIVNKDACVGVIGLGYVGLPLAMAFAQKGFKVLGIDTDTQRVERIRQLKSYIADVPNAAIGQVMRREKLLVSTDFDLLGRADVVITGEVISVEQTPNTTRAQIRILQSLKGRKTAGSLVAVETSGGKVFIDESEPTFTTPQANLLFLQKTGSGYVCVNRADGQKIVRNANLYPFHDNLTYSVPLKDYLKELESAIKAIVAAQRGSAPQ